MTNVTRAELEACARLLGTSAVDERPADLMALARAARLRIDYRSNCVESFSHRYYWPNEGTEAECILKAAAAVQIEREKRNG